MDTPDAEDPYRITEHDIPGNPSPDIEEILAAIRQDRPREWDLFPAQPE
jgi:hypothetical protein